MKLSSVVAGLLLAFAFAASTAWGQITVYDPITTYGAPDAAVTVWRPVDPTDLPPTTVTPAGTSTVTYSTPYTYSVPVVTHYAPNVSAPVTTYYYPSDITYDSAPVTTYYSPAVTTYSPVVTRRYASAPIVTYYAAPVTVGYAAPVVALPPSYVVGSGVLGQPVAYVPGQPVRNVLRFFSP